MGDAILAFELMSDRCVRFACRHVPGVTAPFNQEHAWYVLTDVAVGKDSTQLERTLMAALEAGLVTDAVIAKNENESTQLWRMRHALSEAQKPEGASLKHDISVPTGRIPDFIARGERLVDERMSGARLVTFGHLGDGNLHYNVSQPEDVDSAEFIAKGRDVTEAIYDLATELGGSFSAEHGVGVFKKEYLERYRGGTELRLMRALKQAFDPQNTLNPGKVI
jgi:FAD/FMN-containing dehydrogenase